MEVMEKKLIRLVSPITPPQSMDPRPSNARPVNQASIFAPFIMSSIWLRLPKFTEEGTVPSCCICPCMCPAWTRGRAPLRSQDPARKPYDDPRMGESLTALDCGYL